MTAIYRGPKAGYTLTHDDMLWFARGIGGETWGGATRQDAQWHFWCWMDRFQLWKGPWQGPTGIPKEGKFGELLIQYHSQALSPKWANNGTPAQIANRLKWTTRTQEQLEQDGLWAFAVEAANGTLGRPTKRALYDFASCRNTGAQGRPCPGIELGGQCFLPYKCLRPQDIENLIRNDDGSLPGAVTTGTTVGTIVRTVAGLAIVSMVGWGIYTLARR